MSRYIDADKLIKMIDKDIICLTKDGEECKRIIMEQIGKEWFAPTADVVEIVRCKDCKWCEITKYNDGEVEYGCDCVGGLNCAEADAFCSYGERKEK